MNKKIARITQEKKLLLANEVVEGNAKTSLNSDGRLEVDEIIEYPAELEGGRNLFRPSLVNNLAWVATGGIGYGELRSNPNWRGFYIPVKPGEIYSLSRTEIINNRFRVYFTEKEPADGIPVLQKAYLNDTALKIEGIEVPEGANYLFVYLSNQADKLPKIKLEYGNKATDWTPAPEDLGLNYPDNIQNFNSSISGNNIITPEFIEGYPFVKPVIDDSLVLWLDGSTGNNYEKTNIWKDLSGNGNDGRLMNFDFTEDSGWVDGGLKFDGVNDYVETKEAYIDFPLSYEVCFKYHEIRNYNGVISTYRYGSGNSYRKGFRLHPLGGNLCVSFGNMTTNEDVIIKRNIELNKIYHVVIVFKEDFTQFKVLVNGELSTHDIPIWYFPDEKKIRWGCSGVDHGAYFSNITIYGSRVYNRALTDEEIMQNYQAGLCSPLLVMRGEVIG